MRHLPFFLIVAACCLSATANGAPPASGSAGTTPTVGVASGAAASGQRRGNLAASALLCSLFAETDRTGPGAPPTTAAKQPTDAEHAIEFGSLWTAEHQTTVGSRPSVDAAPVVATVKLPIVLTAAERKQFQDAGWTPRYDETGRRQIYCLENSRRADGSSAAARRGSLCVTSGS